MIQKTIPVSLVVESQTNPRQDFEETGLKELADSIKQHGLLHPIVVRPRKENLELQNALNIQAQYELVSGARRLRAHLLLGMNEIRVEVMNVDDEGVVAIQIAENLHRHDLNPMDMAASMNYMLTVQKFSVDEVAIRVGKSRRFVYQYLHLEKLVDEAKVLVHSGFLPVTHAIRISALEPKAQKKALKATVSFPFGEEKAPVVKGLNELEAWLKKHIFLPLDKAPFDIRSEELVKDAGKCTLCEKRSRQQAALFSDEVSQGDNCLDGECHASKVQAHLKRQLAAVEVREGEKPVQIAAHWENGLGEEVMYAHNLEVIQPEDKCASCKVGVYVNGERAGQSCYFCTGCLQQEPAPQAPEKGVAGESPKQTEKRQEALGEKMQRKAQALGILNIRHWAGGKGQYVMQAALAEIWKNLAPYQAQLIVWRMGWELEGGETLVGMDNQEDYLNRHLQGMNPTDTVLLMAYCVALLNTDKPAAGSYDPLPMLVEAARLDDVEVAAQAQRMAQVALEGIQAAGSLANASEAAVILPRDSMQHYLKNQKQEFATYANTSWLGKMIFDLQTK